MSINTKYRTDSPEIMDDFTLEGEVLREALDKIAKINQNQLQNFDLFNYIDPKLEKDDPMLLLKTDYSIY